MNNIIINKSNLRNLANDCYVNEYLNNIFCVFKSINDILYLVYSTIKRSIVFYNIIDNKKIIEIKNAHNKDISNLKHFFDKIEKRDLLISISYYDNNIKLWNIINLNCLSNIRRINNNGILYSACFLSDSNQNYFVTSNFAFGGTYVEPIKIYDFKGNKIKEINDSNDDTYFIDIYYDKKDFKNYIITANYNYIKSYDYNQNTIYHKYYDCESFEHVCLIIDEKEEGIIKLIDTSKDGNIRIWNFYSCELLNKININIDLLFGIYLWNNDYLFFGKNNKIIKLVKLKERIIIKNIFFYDNYVVEIKMINHPIFGKCLLFLHTNHEIQLFNYENIN